MSGARSSRIGRFFAFIERILRSSTVQLICFAVVLDKVVLKAGLGFSEYLLLLIAYIGITHRIERIEKAVAPSFEKIP